MKREIWCPLAEMQKEKLWYAIVTRDRQGKIVSRERRKSHSFLKQWNQLIYVHVVDRSEAINKTDGTPVMTSPYEDHFKMAQPGAATAWGMRVGTGNTPVDIEDYALETPIENGVGVGQMTHLACTVATSVVAAPSCSFLVSRSIVNNSGGVITVREAGIYMTVATGTSYACGIRDVLTVPQTVPDGGAITIDWTIGVTI